MLVVEAADDDIMNDWYSQGYCVKTKKFSTVTFCKYKIDDEYFLVVQYTMSFMD